MPHPLGAPRAMVLAVVAASACVSSEPAQMEVAERTVVSFVPRADAEARAWLDDTRVRFRARSAPATALLPTAAPGLAWDVRGDAIRVRATARPSPDTRVAEVDLPRSGDAPFRLRDPAAGMEIAIGLVGAVAAPAVIADGWVLYRNAAPDLHVIQRPDPAGTEDFFVLDRAPTRPELRMRVALSQGVAGLRLVANALELLDATGTPRLHMARPWVVDSTGELRFARVEIEGCTVDRDPAAPWGRKVTEPGASECTVRLVWDATLLAPLLVDPTWSLTGKKGVRGQFHDLAVLSTGKILMAGGAAVGLFFSSSELFDPTTATWSATSDMANPRYFHSLVATGSGGALAAGGNSDFFLHSSAEVYDASSGTWAATGSMSVWRSHHRAVTLGSGKILVVSGSAGAEVWDPSPGTWSATGTMSVPDRLFHAATLLADGRVLVVGGGNPFSGSPPVTSSAEIYNPSTNTWTATGSLVGARAMPGITRLSSGKVLVVGGQVSSSTELKTAELFDPSTGTWSSLPSMTDSRSAASVLALPSGNAFVVGGHGISAPVTTELLGISGPTWTASATLPLGFSEPGATRLPDGRVLVVSSENMEAAIARVEVPLGKACAAAGDCGSGFCADGVCCDKACADPCTACTAAGKGSGTDGTCAVVGAGLDPRSDCKDDGSPKCGFDGACDGAGACRKYSVASGCAPSACRTGSDCSTGYCVDGVCCDKPCKGRCEACSHAIKGAGLDGVCEPWAAGTDPRDRCAVGAPCKADGLCDGAGECRTASPKGTTCGSASCAAGKVTGSLCDGAGTCSVTDLACEPYACGSGAACATTCVTDAECATTAYCDAGACVPKKKNGTVAGDPRQCTSGFVSDGLCCDTACKGLCENCARAGSAGSCVPQIGPPVHGTCTASTAKDPCAASACDGAARGDCAGLAGPETVCRPAACIAGKEFAAASCAGTGKCPTTSGRSCAPFACGDKTCKAACTRTEDCAPGFACEVATKKCISGASCDGDRTVTLLDGTRVDCSPLKCAGSGCRRLCASSDDCIAGYACDVSTGACDPIGGGGGDASSGCSFGERGRSRSAAGSLGAALLAAVAVLGRRRRRVAVSAAIVVSTLGAAHGCAPDPETAPSSTDPEAERAVSRLLALTAVASHPRASLRRARVTLAPRGDRPFELSDPESGLSLKVRLEGSGDAPAVRVGERVVYLGARLGGLDVVHHPGDDGTEDWVWIEQRPARAELRYELTLGDGVAGLRLVENVLELLDEGGTPRLRVRSPFVVSADKTRQPADLSLERCAADRDPRAPWGRPVVAPRARTCTLRVDWTGRPVAYPLAVDPDWVTTAAMVTPRTGQGSGTLAAGKVLIAGGSTMTANVSTAELFDSATRTFAATGSMSIPRSSPTILPLSGGDALATLGKLTMPDTHERYKVSSGTWIAAAVDPFVAIDPGFRWVELADGKVLKTGGGEGSKGSTLYDPAADSWTSVGPMTTLRAGHTLTRLSSGLVLAAGGWTTKTPLPVATSNAETYDPTSKTWTAVSALATARHDHSATLLSTGKVLVAGGANASTRFSSAELFDPATKTFSPTGALSTWRTMHAVARLGSGNVLVIAGKLADSTASRAAEVYAVAPGKFVPAADWWGDYYIPTLDPLPDGGALAIAISKVQVFPAQLAAGAACTSSGDCASGFCVDSVCCNQACDKGCEACSAAFKASGVDGTCGPEKAGTDRHDGCKDDGAATCGKNGLCDGAGGCQKYPASTGCAPMACTTGSECTSGFCVDSICCDGACTGACEACTAAAKGGSTDGKCGPVAAGTDPRDRCASDPGFPASCKADGMCDGKGACRTLAPTGTTCGPAKCEAGTATGALCNGAGACVSASAKCAPFACKDAVTCATSCATDADCAADRYCAGTACVPRKAAGELATAGRECASGFAADSVCCNAACTGTCEACDQAGSKGTCVAVVGAARHGSCPTAATGGDPCVAALCDGKVRDKCGALAAGDVACRAAACIEGEEIAPATCDGSGVCPTGKTRTCAPYACGSDDVCRTSCKTDVDCAPGAKCDGTKCVGVSVCDGQHTVTSPSGSKSNCTPYRCDDTGCRTDCRSSLDCVFGYLCDSATKQCTAVSTNGTEASSGCALAPAPRRGAQAWLACLALAGLLARQRRRTG